MGNELKLSIENFQSISHGELIFHTGTTVIIGQSNSGKTATFRALKACLSNPAGSQRFIKNGTKKATVTLEYNGNEICWQRTEKDSSYTINGGDFIKTGKSCAFKLVDDIGFVRDDNDIIMNIEEELQLPFPFGISKSELFKLYENVFCVSDSAVILKSAKEHEDNIKSNISLLENDLIKNKNKLKEILNFKEIFEIEKLNTYKEFLNNKQERINFLQDGLGIIKKAVKIDSININNINSYEIKNLLYTYNDFVRVKHDIRELKELHLISKSVPQGIVFLNKTEKYYELINMKKIRDNMESLNTVEFPIFEFSNKLEHYQELIKYKKDINNIIERIKTAKENKKGIDGKVLKFEEELKKVDVCPLCGRPF